MRIKPAAVSLVAALAIPLILFSEEHVDLSIVNRIRAEAFSNSKVMDTMFYLTDLYGPRLTNSPNFKSAGDWAVNRLQQYGLADVKEEKWGPFGRGWECKFFEAHMVEPQFSSLVGIPLAWTGGTGGSVTGAPIFAPIRSEADFDAYRGKLKGKIVMISDPHEFALPLEAEGHRYTSGELAQMIEAPEPEQSPLTRPAAPGQRPRLTREERERLRLRSEQFLKDEGVLLTISESSAGLGGAIFAQSGGSQDPKRPIPVPGVALMPEQYNRIARLLEHNIPVTLEFNIDNRFYTDDTSSFNVIGEIPGAGPHKDEMVMFGAHLDSWHGGTGATDNAAGSAVMIEAARILESLHQPMDRTVAIALWGGEEQGLLGSQAYVKEHFGDPDTMKLTAQHAKLSGYFNYDNGTGKIRGVYLQSNDMMRPVFEAWLAPFKDLGVTAISIRDTDSTDHISFDAVGLPGFQFIQDPLDYETRTHHSNLDVYDRIQPADLMQASAVIASVVYDAATRPDLLPRKPLPKPRQQPTTPQGFEAAHAHDQPGPAVSSPHR